MVNISCTNYKNIAYLNDISDSLNIYNRGKVIKEAEVTPLEIQKDDILQVTISTIDPALNGAGSISNLNSDNLDKASKHIIPDMSSLNGYLVDKNGCIELPIIGKILVTGLTLDSAKELIREKALFLFKKPVINLRLLSFKITVLGEVNKPGTYLFNGDKASIFDALGMANDLSIYGKRENVMLIRQEAGGQKRIVRIDLNNSDLISSPYFYLKQGDVLYVEPSKGKAAATDMANTKFYTIGASILSLLIIAISRIN